MIEVLDLTRTYAVLTGESKVSLMYRIWEELHAHKQTSDLKRGMIL